MSNKKLRNVRFEVPQMSEEMGFRWCLRRWRMRNRLPKNLARMQFGRLGIALLADWRYLVERVRPMAQGSQSFRCSEHANSKFA